MDEVLVVALTTAAVAAVTALPDGASHIVRLIDVLVALLDVCIIRVVAMIVHLQLYKLLLHLFFEVNVADSELLCLSSFCFIKLPCRFHISQALLLIWHFW